MNCRDCTLPAVWKVNGESLCQDHGENECRWLFNCYRLTGDRYYVESLSPAPR